MALLAGNIGLKISSRPHFLVFVIPWVRKNNEIMCSKGRDYTSSVPVRYIPKKSSSFKESEYTLPAKSLEKNKLGKTSNGSDELRYEVSNGGRAIKESVVVVEKHRDQIWSENSSNNNLFSDNDNKQVVKLQSRNQNEKSSKNNLLFDNDAKQVEKLQTQNQIEISSKNNLSFVDGAKQDEKLQNQNQNQIQIQSETSLLFDDDDAKQGFEEEINYDSGVVQPGLMEEAEKATQLAIKLLARRAFTAVELRKKLNGKKFSPDTVDAVLKNIKIRGFINDGLYAETYSQSRWSSSTWGPKRIKQALFNKGISNVDADKAVKLVFRNAESVDDQESILGMSKLSMDHLFVQASKQWLRSQDAPKETRKVRIVRWLQYRGFNWGVTNYILKKLETQYPPAEDNSQAMNGPSPINNGPQFPTN